MVLPTIKLTRESGRKMSAIPEQETDDAEDLDDDSDSPAAKEQRHARDLSIRRKSQDGKPRKRSSVVQVEGIMKMSFRARRILMRVSCGFSMLSCALIWTSTFTNEWIHSAEVLKFWTSNLSDVDPDLPEYKRPIFFKNATFGPWKYCWLDPITHYTCHPVEFFPEGEVGDATDSTTAVEMATRKTIFFLIPTACLTTCGTIGTFISIVLDLSKSNFILILGVVDIFAGLGNLLLLVVYLSSVNQEVGKKLFAPTPIDSPTFYYHYGFSFYALIGAYYGVQLAAGLALCVYMAKHDSDIYNKYQILSICKLQALAKQEEAQGATMPEKSRRQSMKRNRFRRSSITSSVSLRLAENKRQPSLIDAITSTGLKPGAAILEQSFPTADSADSGLGELGEKESPPLLPPPIRKKSSTIKPPVMHSAKSNELKLILFNTGGDGEPGHNSAKRPSKPRISFSDESPRRESAASAPLPPPQRPPPPYPYTLPVPLQPGVLPNSYSNASLSPSMHFSDSGLGGFNI